MVFHQITCAFHYIIHKTIPLYTFNYLYDKVIELAVNTPKYVLIINGFNHTAFLKLVI